MKRITLSLLTLLVAAVGTQAKSWKIGPSSVEGMDFASISAAMTSTNVAAGDTLYLNQFYNESAAQDITKGVVIIGTGYDTNLTDEQVVASVPTINLKAKGIIVKSLNITSAVVFYNESCLLDRCKFTYANASSNTVGLNKIYSCYVTSYVSGNGGTGTYDIQNCLFVSGNYSVLYSLKNATINNNTIVNSYTGSNSNCTLQSVTNSQITNNIIIKTGSYRAYIMDSNTVQTGCGNKIEHNLLTATISNFPTNKVITISDLSDVFALTGSYSDQYKLSEKSPALGYATDGGECGCHGGMFGIPAGGRPQYIPYFSKVTVGQRTENGKLPVSLTVKIQDK